MNKSFSDGNRIVRATETQKTMGTTGSPQYFLWFLRESQYLNRSRMLLRTSCAVSGTGFVSPWCYWKSGGWKVTPTGTLIYNLQCIKRKKLLIANQHCYMMNNLLNSARHGSADAVGKKDIQVFRNYGTKLIKLFFKKEAFITFDMIMATIPAIVLSVLGSIINICGAVLGFLTGDNLLLLLKPLCESAISAYLMFFIIGCHNNFGNKIYCGFQKFYIYYIPHLLFTSMQYQWLRF